jgi:hypothetical protein
MVPSLGNFWSNQSGPEGLGKIPGMMILGLKDSEKIIER